MTDERFAEIVSKVTAVAQDVYRALGNVHLEENAYDRAMRIGLQGVVEFVSQPVLPVMYRGLSVCELRPDFYLLIKDGQTIERVVLELKVISQLQEGGLAYRQVQTYLRHGRIERGIAVNFSFVEDGAVQVETFRAW
jgi:GxxExxY protein